MSMIQEVLSRVNSIFNSRNISNLMCECDVIKRKREIEALPLLRALLKSSLSHEASAASITETLYHDEKVEISRQGMHKKVKKCVDFSAKLLELVLSQHNKNHSKTLKFNGLKDLILVDSSEINKQFKIQVIYSSLRQKIIHLETTKINQNDQSYKKHLDFVKKDTLLCADLGYFALNTFLNIIDSGGFFLSRYFKRALIHNSNGEKIEINTFLAQKGKKTVDIPVLLGSSYVPCRLVCIRLNSKQQAQRDKNIKEKRRRDKRISTVDIQNDKWNVFVTNLPQEKFNPQLCYEIYAHRWQIELLFKAIKTSGLGINKYNTQTVIGKVMFYFKLIVAVLIFQLHDEREKNVSILKLFKKIPIIIFKKIDSIGKWTVSMLKGIRLIMRKFCKSYTYKNRRTSSEKMRDPCLS